MAAVLTFDLGTTYFKAALFDGSGRLIALQREPTPATHPSAGWWELDADRFRTTLASLVRTLGENAPAAWSGVEAVTFATQTNSFLLLNGNDRPLTPILLWPDERAREYEPAVRQLARAEGFRAATGVPMLGSQFMAAKLLWLRERMPDVWRRVRRVCLISDYLTLWLTGCYATEAGAAGLTGLVDVHQLEWRPDACERLGVDRGWLPDVVRAGTDVGAILPEAAEELGLPTACRFVVGCLDQYAGAIGAGNISDGGVSETTGTVLSTVRYSSRFEAGLSPRVFQGPAFAAGAFYQMVFGSTSANLLEEYRNRLSDRPEFRTLDEAAAAVPAGADGLRLGPCPDAADVMGAFVGRNRRHGRGHEVRAIFEAVAFALADQVCDISTGQPPSEIRSIGGAASSDLWLQIKADVLGVPFAATTCAEPTSLGAAMLAATALGWADLPTLAKTWVTTKPPHRPDAANHEVYRRIHESVMRA